MLATLPSEAITRGPVGFGLVLRGHCLVVASRARTHAERLVSRDGYFTPESVIRRIGNSPVTPFLGGGPAVLLQVAHPLVAAGVVQHSDFEHDLWRRLVRTLRALYLIAFGTKAGPERAGTNPARKVAAVIFAADLPAPMRVLVPAHRLATAGVLPPRLRDEYELRWTPLHEYALPLAARSLRAVAAPVLFAASRMA